MLRVTELFLCFILLLPIFFSKIVRADNDQINKSKMPLRWGIVSAGKISNDFVSALKNLPSSDQLVVAVAARDKSRADKFASTHNISSSYGSYEELAKDPNVDVVYVGSINTQHFPISKLMLDHGKHVLCEKPLCLNYKQAEELLKYAKLKGLFLMEAIWSRFFPAYEEVRKALESKAIGDVKQLTANFGFKLVSERVSKKDLGGSAVLDIGVYPLQLATMVFGTNTSYEILTAGHVSESNVDESFSTVIKYPDGKAASLVVHTRVTLENHAYIYGTEGFIMIHQPMWCPTKITIKGETKEFPLPDKVKGSYNYVNSPGLQFEAIEVKRCIQEGLLESPFMSHNDSLTIAKMEDTIRKQLGVKFDVDEN